MTSPAHAMAAVLRAGADGGLQDLDRSGIVLTNAVKVLLSQPGQGRYYYRRRTPGGSLIAHRASAPGDPPAVDTGTYRSAWTWSSAQVAPGVFQTRVYPDPAHLTANGEPDELGAWLEFGTSKMDARPHLRPAVNSSQQVLARSAEVGIETRQRTEAVRRGGRG